MKFVVICYTAIDGDQHIGGISAKGVERVRGKIPSKCYSHSGKQILVYPKEVFELDRSLRSEPGVHLPKHTCNCLQISHTCPKCSLLNYTFFFTSIRTNIFGCFVGARHCVRQFTHILNFDPHNQAEIYV